MRAFVLLDLFRQAKVGYDDVTCRRGAARSTRALRRADGRRRTGAIEQNILRLEIAVNDVERVEMRDGAVDATTPRNVTLLLSSSSSSSSSRAEPDDFGGIEAHALLAESAFALWRRATP